MVDRLLFADAVKIVGISLIVFYHVTTSGIYPWLGQYQISLGFSSAMYPVYYGSIGITMLIFASGICLTFNHPSLNSKLEIKNFYTHRILRIYPAYWVAILLALALNQSLLNQPFSAVDVFRNISGFQAFGVTSYNGFWGQINPTFWFIGLIVFALSSLSSSSVQH
jgi:peptidoglycan/LPS O-acetylase OafA/YrhL